MALPFDQRSNESTPAWEAFTVYRDMRAERSHEAVGQKLGKSSALISRWSKRHEWVIRARAYDIAMDARLRHATEQDAIKQRREMLQAHAEEARGLRMVARRILAEFERRWGEKGTLQWISGDDFVKVMSQLPKIIQTAHQLERLATGEPAENLEPPKPFEQMTNDELDAYIKRLQTAIEA